MNIFSFSQLLEHVPLCATTIGFPVMMTDRSRSRTCIRIRRSVRLFFAGRRHGGAEDGEAAGQRSTREFNGSAHADREGPRAD